MLCKSLTEASLVLYAVGHITHAAWHEQVLTHSIAVVSINQVSSQRKCSVSESKLRVMSHGLTEYTALSGEMSRNAQACTSTPMYTALHQLDLNISRMITRGTTTDRS